MTSVLINKPALKLEGAGKAKERKTKADPDANRFSRRLVCAFFTFILVDFAWLFFRADSVGASLHILKRIVFSPEIGRTIFEGLCLAGVEVKKAGLLIAELFILLLVDLCHEKNIRVSEWLDGQDKWFRWTIYVTMAMFIIIGMLRDYGMDASTFIYAAF